MIKAPGFFNVFVNLAKSVLSAAGYLSLNNRVLDMRVFSLPPPAQAVFATLPSRVVECHNLYETGRERGRGGMGVKTCPETA